MMNEVSRSTIWRIIGDDLNLRKVAAQWVTQSLTDKLKGQRAAYGSCEQLSTA